ATPHVTGAIADLAQARWGATKYYGPQLPEIESALESAGPVVTDPRSGVSKHRLDVFGAASMLAHSDATPDTTAPQVATPLEQFDGAISGNSVPVRVSWNATDASGVAAYELYVSTNGGSWVLDSNLAASARQVTYWLAVGSTYYFQVRAKDGAGNWGVSQ